MPTLEGFSDQDFRRTILRALRLLLVLTVVALPLAWWRIGGWRGAAMLLVGASISASGLWEWLRLLTALMVRMDAEMPAEASAGLDSASDVPEKHASETVQQDDTEAVAEVSGERPKVRGMGMLLTGFFVRLGVVVVILYVSLRYLEGSVVALAVGLGLGVVSLTVEGLRLVKAWTG